MKKQVPILPIIGIAIVIVAAVVYMMLIRPKGSEAAGLDEQIAVLETKVSSARLASQSKDQEAAIKVADVFELSKAMPDSSDMPGVILDLNSVAAATGVTFASIAPKPPTAKTGYAAIGIDLIFVGNYFDLTDFLFRLRNLVTVRDGRLSSSGRLFTLDTLDLKESDDSFPFIHAALTVSAYSFGTPDASAASTLPLPTTTDAAPVAPPGGLG